MILHMTMTAKLTADIDFITSIDRRPAYNSGCFAKVVVQCFVEVLWVYKINGENMNSIPSHPTHLSIQYQSN